MRVAHHLEGRSATLMYGVRLCQALSQRGHNSNDSPTLTSVKGCDADLGLLPSRWGHAGEADIWQGLCLSRRCTSHG